MLNSSKIRTLRNERGLSQDDMAEKMNISPTSYARLERGEVQPKIKKLQQLAQILEVEMNELLESGDKNVSLSVSVNENNELSQSSAQAGWNFYHSHNNYYGNDALAAEIDKLQQALRHKDDSLQQLNALLAQKDREIALLREMLAMLKKERV